MNAKLSQLDRRGDMPDQPRSIVHLDLDAFYAAVEVLENTELVGKPVVVGGSSEGRGVVSAASYPARAYGIRSAMPTYRALQLCPQAIVLPPRHRLYREYSRRVMDILYETQAPIEQMSIDEACLELTDQLDAWEQGVELARRLQRQVREQTGLSASLGVATNKLVAKVASDQDKPGGLTVVRPGDEAAFLAPLPVRVLWGVGPVTAAKLGQMGINTVGDLAQLPKEELQARFGRNGLAMARQAQGIDRRRVVTQRQAKSVSHERTFARDIQELGALQQQVQRLSQLVARHLTKTGLATGTIALKLRYSDFETISRQTSLAVSTNEEKEISRVALALLARSWQPGRPVRLLGVAGRDLCRPSGQLSLL